MQRLVAPAPHYVKNKKRIGVLLMLEWLGFIYGIAKDLKDYLEFEETDKLVAPDWIKKSGFAEKWSDKGYKLRWERPDKIESRRLEGWEVLYEVDKIKRLRRRIVLRDGMVLIGKAI